jgi:hypothetical protein
VNVIVLQDDVAVLDESDSETPTSSCAGVQLNVLEQNEQLIPLAFSVVESGVEVNYLTFIHERNRLGGLVVSVLTTGPRGRGLKPDRGDGYLRAIKICSTPSFGSEVKPEVPCHKILQHVKDLLTYLRY